AVLYKELKVMDAETLKTACIEGKVETVKGFGKKTAQNILTALEILHERPDRLPVAYMLQLAEKIEQYLASIPEITKFSLAGSLRRLKEMIRDIDFIIATDQPGVVREQILQLDLMEDV